MKFASGERKPAQHTDKTWPWRRCGREEETKRVRKERSEWVSEVRVARPAPIGDEIRRRRSRVLQEPVSKNLELHREVVEAACHDGL